MPPKKLPGVPCCICYKSHQGSWLPWHRGLILCSFTTNQLYINAHQILDGVFAIPFLMQNQYAIEEGSGGQDYNTVTTVVFDNTIMTSESMCCIKIKNGTKHSNNLYNWWSKCAPIIVGIALKSDVAILLHLQLCSTHYAALQMCKKLVCYESTVVVMGNVGE